MHLQLHHLLLTTPPERIHESFSTLKVLSLIDAFIMLHNYLYVQVKFSRLWNGHDAHLETPRHSVLCNMMAALMSSCCLHRHENDIFTLCTAPRLLQHHAATFSRGWYLCYADFLRQDSPRENTLPHKMFWVGIIAADNRGWKVKIWVLFEFPATAWRSFSSK